MALTTEQAREMRAGKNSAVGSTKRIQALNQQFHSCKPSVDLQRARAFTKVFKETEGEPWFSRRYKAFAEHYATIEPVIYDHERIVMWQGKKPRSGPIQIDIQATWLKDENLEDLATRSHDPFDITPEEIQELNEVHIPYWYEKTALYRWKKTTPNWDRYSGTGILDVTNFFNPGSHFVPAFQDIFRHGFKGYAEKARECLAKVNPHDPDDIYKKEYYEGLIAVCESIKTLGDNYAKKALDMAAEEKDPVRRQELEKIADVCSHVPWEAPRDFQEGIQVCWTMLMLLMIEGSGPGMSLGRPDQYLYPLYKKDIENGVLTPEGAMEFIEELYIKCTQYPWVSPAANAVWFSGYYRFENMTVGGVDALGNDVTNELSYLFVRAMRHVRTMGPSVGVFIGPKTPDTFLYEALKLAAEGMGHPSFFDVNTTHRMLEYRASGNEGKSTYSLKDIREYGTSIGCVEPCVAGEQFGHTASCLSNLGMIMVLTLNNGVKPAELGGPNAGVKVGAETGDPKQFKTYEELEKAYMDQMKFFVDDFSDQLIRIEKILKEIYQLPLFSITSVGCIEKGIDVTLGGAICNIGPCHTNIGLADTANSLAALRKVVFDDKKYTMEQVIAACKANFEGYEALRADLLNAPKYGNNDNYVDDIAVRVMENYARDVRSRKSVLGHYMDPGVQPVQVNVTSGLGTPALPSGRKAGEALADAMSAFPQTDVEGPTAAILSYGKIDCTPYVDGTVLNMWINRNEIINA